jgi:hypothetical protein
MLGSKSEGSTDSGSLGFSLILENPASHPATMVPRKRKAATSVRWVAFEYNVRRFMIERFYVVG